MLTNPAAVSLTKTRSRVGCVEPTRTAVPCSAWVMMVGTIARGRLARAKRIERANDRDGQVETSMEA